MLNNMTEFASEKFKMQETQQKKNTLLFFNLYFVLGYSRLCESLGGKGTLEEGMATYSNILAWRIPWTEEPGRLQSMWSHKVGHEVT